MAEEKKAPWGYCDNKLADGKVCGVALLDPGLSGTPGKHPEPNPHRVSPEAAAKRAAAPAAPHGKEK